MSCTPQHRLPCGCGSCQSGTPCTSCSSPSMAVFRAAACSTVLNCHSVTATEIVRKRDACPVLQCLCLLLRRQDRLKLLKLLAENEIDMQCSGL